MKTWHWFPSALLTALLAALLTAIPLVACAPITTQTPSPTLHLLRVGLSPAVQPWKTHVESCAEKLPGYGLILDELVFEADTWDRYDVVIYLGLPESFSGFSTQIGAETFALIVNSANPIESIAAERIVDIYTASITTWALVETDGSSFTQPITPWIYPERDFLHQAFKRAARFPDGARVEATIAPDPGAMLEAVASESGAIGYVPTRWLSDPIEGVKPVTWDGDPVELPVLGLAESDPQGAVRSLLVCLDQLDP